MHGVEEMALRGGTVEEKKEVKGKGKRSVALKWQQGKGIVLAGFGDGWGSRTHQDEY